MAVNGCSVILTSVKWDVENDSFLSDFVERHRLPHAALVTKGQYLGVGAPNVGSPHLKPYVYVHSKRKIKKLIGQVVKSTKEGKGRTFADQSIGICEQFGGYFEILSEDGRPAKCVESVSELNDKFPDMCLVRQQCKAYVPDSDGELRSLYKSRVVQEGEVLTLCGLFNFKKSAFLRCFDETGRSVYLKMSQKIKFSHLAKKDELDGVHDVQSLMSKRLPLTVRLIHGEVSSELSKFHSSAHNLVVRLQRVFVEEVVFAYSMNKPDGQFVSLPLNAHLKLAPTYNYGQIASYPEFRDLRDLCENASISYYDRIVPFNSDMSTTAYDSVLDLCGKEIRKSEKAHVTNVEIGDSINIDENNGEAPTICDEEIDQLYDYIRGLAPLPQQTEGHRRHHRRRRSKPQSPPPPPPIDSIPGYNSHSANRQPKDVASNSLHRNFTPTNEYRVIPTSTSPRRMRVSSPKSPTRRSPPSPTRRCPPSPTTPIQAQQIFYEQPNGRLLHHSSTSTSPSGTTSAPSIEKRLDGILYSSRGALVANNGVNSFDRHNKKKSLSKSVDKFIIVPADEYVRPSNDDNELNGNRNNSNNNCTSNNITSSNPIYIVAAATATPSPHTHGEPSSSYNNYNSSNSSHRNHYRNGAQGQQHHSKRRRPYSMVIPDRMPLFPAHQAQAAEPLRPSVNYHTSMLSVARQAAPSRNNDYSNPHQAYRSFANLSSRDPQVNSNSTYRSRSPSLPKKLQSPLNLYPSKVNVYPRYIQQQPSTHFRV